MATESGTPVSSVADVSGSRLCVFSVVADPVFLRNWVSGLAENRAGMICRGSYGSLAEAAAVLEPDAAAGVREVVILDWTLPDGISAKLIGNLRSLGARMRYIILTSVEAADLDPVFELEPDGLVMNRSGSEALVECIAAVSKGGRYRCIWSRVAEASRKVARERSGIDFTLMLRLMLEGSSPRQIAAESGTQPGEVLKRLDRLKNLISIDSTAELLERARGSPPRAIQ